MIRSGMRGLAVSGLAVLLMLMTGCGGKAPQTPSQRKGQAPEADSATLALMEFNSQLAKAADKTVMDAVQAQEEPFALYEGQTWMHIVETGDTDGGLLIPGQAYSIHMRVYTLDGRMLEDTEGTYLLGKAELPAGIDWNIRELHHGAKARLFIPWYMAFGPKGNEHIPPYENVRIDLEIR